MVPSSVAQTCSGDSAGCSERFLWRTFIPESDTETYAPLTKPYNDGSPSPADASRLGARR